MVRSAIAGLCRIVRVVPRRHRFGVMRAVAPWLRPVVAATAMGRRRVDEGIDTAREITLYKILAWVTRTGTEFDVPIVHEGIEQLDGAIAAGRGVLIACVHGLLNHAMYRFLQDDGIVAWGLAMQATPVLGTRALPRLVPASAMQLRDVQRLLHDGGVLCAMLDRSELTKRSADLALPHGSLRINDALFRVAALAGATILFCSTRVDARYRIVLTWHTPDAPPYATTDLPGVVASFQAFLAATLPGQRAHGTAADDARRVTDSPELVVFPRR